MKLFKKVTFIMLAIILTNVLYADSSLYSVTHVNRNDHLNMRSGPGTQYKIVGVMRSNTTNVSMLGKSRNKGKSRWVKVKSGSSKGWVNAHYLKKVSNTSKKTPFSQALKSNTRLKQDIKIAIYETLFTYYRLDSKYITPAVASTHVTPSILPISVSISPNVVNIYFKDNYKESGIEWGKDDLSIGHALFINVNNVLSSHSPTKQLKVDFYFDGDQIDTLL